MASFSYKLPVRIGSLIKRGKPSARDLFRLGDQSRDRREWAVAAAHYEQGLGRQPGRFDIWVQLGNMLKEMGEYDRAKGTYGRASALRPDDPDLHVQFGHLYALLGAQDKARGHYGRAIALGHSDTHAVQFMAASPAIPGASPGTTEEVASPSSQARALDRPPATNPSAASLFQRADGCRDQRKWAEAAALYEQGLALSPGAFAMWVQFGHMLKESGALAKAQAAYQRALRLRPNDTDLHIQLGHLHLLRDSPGNAREHYACAISLGSRDPNAVQFLRDQPGQDSVVRATMARLMPDEHRSWKVLTSDEPIDNYVKFILRHAG